MCRGLFVLALAAAIAGGSADAATLRSAHATVELFADGVCDVRMRFVTTSEAPATAQHRLLVHESTDVGDMRVTGVEAGAAQRVGRVLVVPIALPAGEATYEAHYRLSQARGEGWCGLLVPDAPTAGVARVVQIDTVLPAGVVRLPGEFPAMQWEDRRGSVALGHVPAFARVPHAMPGEEVGWRRSFDVRRALDITAIVILLGASLIWVARRRRP